MSNPQNNGQETRNKRKPWKFDILISRLWYIAKIQSFINQKDTKHLFLPLFQARLPTSSLLKLQVERKSSSLYTVVQNNAAQTWHWMHLCAQTILSEFREIMWKWLVFISLGSPLYSSLALTKMHTLRPIICCKERNGHIHIKSNKSQIRWQAEKVPWKIVKYHSDLRQSSYAFITVSHRQTTDVHLVNHIFCNCCRQKASLLLCILDFEQDLVQKPHCGQVVSLS